MLLDMYLNSLNPKKTTLWNPLEVKCVFPLPVTKSIVTVKDLVTECYSVSVAFN